ncbi:MAG: DNA repair protein RecO [Cytophagaceae bacterium]
MLHKTKGIVLHFIRYSDTSIIAKIYTEAFGLQSYIVNGVRSKSAKNKIALFQPLTLLDLVVYHKENSTLQRISEMRCAEPYQSIPFEVHKSSIALFTAEILQKTLKEEVSNNLLFEFLYHSLHALDQLTPTTSKNFHVLFLIRYAAYLGFYPTDLDELWKMAAIPNAAIQKYLQDSMDKNYFQEVEGTNQIRREALQLLLNYYSTHIDNFGEVNSYKILQEILS